MSDKLKRLQGLSSAKTVVQEKAVKLAGFEELVNELKEITLAQKQSHESLSKSLNLLSASVIEAGKNGVDITAVVEAINGLKDKLAEKEAMPKLPMDYVIDFDRDKYGLMKTGIRLRSVPQKLN